MAVGTVFSGETDIANIFAHTHIPAVSGHESEEGEKLGIRESDFKK
jgi:hypothetical protein